MKKMIQKRRLSILLFLPIFLFAESTWAGETVSDTLKIQLEDGSVILIMTEDRSGMERLSEYDVNEIIRNVVQTVDSTREVVEDKPEAESPETISLNLGNMEITVVVDEDAIEDDVEEITRENQDEDQIRKTKEIVEKKPPVAQTSFKLDLGLNNWLENGTFPDNSNAPYSVKPWGSWYLAMGSNTRFHIAGPFFTNVGANISFNAFKLSDPSYRIVKGPDQVEFVQQTDLNTQKSKLDIYYANLEIVPMLDFGYKRKKMTSIEGRSFHYTKYKKRGFRIGAGMYGGYRLGSKSKLVYRESGNKVKDKDHSNFFLNNWRYGVRGVVGYRGIDVFFNYDLNELFAENRQPGTDPLHQFSFGITFVTW